MNGFVLFVLGTLLRIGIPVAVTILVIVLLRRLDRRWQKESLVLPVVQPVKPCWEIKGCPKEKSEKCPATAHPEIPCWQVFRSQTGRLKEACLDCDVFYQAPIPVGS